MIHELGLMVLSLNLWIKAYILSYVVVLSKVDSVYVSIFYAFSPDVLPLSAFCSSSTPPG